MAKTDKKADVKVKAGKKDKAPDTKKPVATIPSAKHTTPISSKEILAKVCHPLNVLVCTRMHISDRLSGKNSKISRRRIKSRKNLLKMKSLRLGMLGKCVEHMYFYHSK
jgi:hypothetical protein